MFYEIKKQETTEIAKDYLFSQAERNRWENDRRGDGGSGSESMEMPRGHVPPPRAVTDLCYDLEDAVVLSMVTAYYCPYLVPLHLQDIFLEPEGKYQNIHNAVALTQAWKKLRLGLSATPSWFSNPNPVQMLMLVTHLYTVLPSYVPRLTVFFSGSLSTHIDRVVSLNNPSNKVVRMQVPGRRRTI
ncbi:hypothetical protein AAG570_001991 [Ranatra chinensis]|uniref:Calponin-homology (CH) domain-containing protein n=1 Tax=Ranatra chinensis TaxID=642074 RepID=A0ABD0YAD1_9HEMI